MAMGFVLVTVEPTKEQAIYESLLKVDEVKEVYVLFGEYDLIAKIETEQPNGIGKIVTDKIRTLEGVINTDALIAIKF